MLTFPLLRRYWLSLGATLLLLLLTACGGNQTHVHTKLVALDVMPNANLNHPVALDLIIVYNDALFKDLLQLSSEEWFDKRRQYKLDYPGTLQSWEWELVPGQVVPFFRLPGKAKKGVGALVFANYVTPGQHRARFDPYEGVVIRLMEQEFMVLPLN